MVVEMLKNQNFAVCQFTGATDAKQRHQAIREFQASGEARAGVAKVFVVTVKTGAVGITLTAATRVYLLEPALDPAAEVQAAGRIHRLGQTKEIHIKRFAFKDSIDEAIAALHDKIKSGAVKLVDREFPPEALQHFVDHGVARPHTLDPNASGVTERVRLSNLQREIGLGYNDGRPAPPGVRPSFNGPAHELPPGVARPDKHGFTYKEAPCVCTLLAPEPARLPWP